MLGVLFIGGWVLIGLTLIIVAMSGGPSQARERVLHAQSRRGRRVTGVFIALVLAAFAAAIPTLVIAGNKDSRSAGDAGIKLNASEERGRELFGRTCQQCHTLAEADTVGRVGPNLDVLKPPKSLTLNAIQQGRAQGNGRMPAQLLQGNDATDVANFIAKVAGKQ
jgi:mono/diheme cytochrome c family protein